MLVCNLSAHKVAAKGWHYRTLITLNMVIQHVGCISQNENIESVLNLFTKFIKTLMCMVGAHATVLMNVAAVCILGKQPCSNMTHNETDCKQISVATHKPSVVRISHWLFHCNDCSAHHIFSVAAHSHVISYIISYIIIVHTVQLAWVSVQSSLSLSSHSGTNSSKDNAGECDVHQFPSHLVPSLGGCYQWLHHCLHSGVCWEWQQCSSKQHPPLWRGWGAHSDKTETSHWVLCEGGSWDRCWEGSLLWTSASPYSARKWVLFLCTLHHINLATLDREFIASEKHILWMFSVLVHPILQTLHSTCFCVTL